MRRGVRALTIDLAAATAPMLAVMLVMMLAVAVPARAQLPPVKPDPPVALVADAVEYDTATGRVTASGGVEIY